MKDLAKVEHDTEDKVRNVQLIIFSGRRSTKLTDFHNASFSINCDSRTSELN